MLSTNFLKVVLVIASVDLIFVVQSIVAAPPSCTAPNTALANPSISDFIGKTFNIFSESLIFGQNVTCQNVLISGTGSSPTNGGLTMNGKLQAEYISQDYTWSSYFNGSLAYQPAGDTSGLNTYWLFLFFNNGGASQSAAVKFCPDGGTNPNIIILSTATSLSAQQLTDLQNQVRDTDKSLATVPFNAIGQTNCSSN